MEEDSFEDGYFYDDDIKAPNLLRKKLLNGAMDWLEYSEAGCALVYDEDIAERLCTPGLKEKKGRLHLIERPSSSKGNPKGDRN